MMKATGLRALLASASVVVASVAGAPVSDTDTQLSSREEGDDLEHVQGHNSPPTSVFYHLDVSMLRFKHAVTTF